MQLLEFVDPKSEVGMKDASDGSQDPLSTVHEGYKSSRKYKVTRFQMQAQDDYSQTLNSHISLVSGTESPGTISDVFGLGGIVSTTMMGNGWA